MGKLKKLTKKSLAIALSRLDHFYSQKVRVEQYSTDSEVASTMLWLAHEMDDLEGKEILDMGAGTGILGLGTMFFDPEKVTFLDVDKDALKILNVNMEKWEEYCNITKNEIIHSDMQDYNNKADIIIMNPPFGTKTKHADTEFLKKAFSLAPIIYSIHKSETKDYLRTFAQKNSFKVTHEIDCQFPIKATLKFHRSRIKRINTTIFRFEKTNVTSDEN
jgi:putative methylase